MRAFIEHDPWGESPLPYIENDEWLLVQCEDCSQAFHKRILSPEWMNKCYSEWVTQEAIQKFLETRNTPENNFEAARRRVRHVLQIENLTRRLRNGEAVRVLDFGCGWGEFLALCDGFGFHTSGIDFSLDRRKHGRVSIFPSIDELKRSSKTESAFHVITLFEVLEHLASPSEVIKLLSVLLVQGGLLILETPDCTGVTDITSAEDYRLIHPLSHINAFTPDTLCSIAQRAGFQPINPGVAQVTCDRKRVIKTEIKHVINRFIRPTTQKYFCKM